MFTKLIFILSLLAGATSFAYSQQPIKIFVFDSTTQSPIPFARIVNVGKSTGTISNEYGQAILQKTSISDSILVSTIGYHDKLIICSGTVENIALNPEIYLLKEVLVSASRPAKSKKKPLKLKASAGLCNYYDKGYQIVTIVDALSGQDNIESISIFIRKKIISAGNLRLRLYSIGPDGMPGENLLPKSIIKNGQGARGWIKFSLNGLNIRIPDEGAFAGIEFLDFVDDNKEAICVGLTDQFNVGNTWIQSIGGTWHQLPFIKNKSGIPYNVMIKVE